MRELVAIAGLPFADDETNVDPTFARNRIRAEVLPVLRELNPAAERNVAETRGRARRGGGAARARRARGPRPGRRRRRRRGDPGRGARPTGSPACAAWRCARSPSAPRAGRWRWAACAPRRSSAWPREPEGGTVDLGGGLVAICESGLIRFRAAAVDAAPAPAALNLPGRVRVGGWEVRAELHPGPVTPAGPDLATLDAAALRGPIEVRTWREGDRIRPLGMTGTKTLGDLFADRGVPRSVRPTLPVVTVGGEIAWVAGVAVSEPFRLDPDAERVAVLTARALD